MARQYELMTVDYTEMDNGCPALCFCNDLIIPITNASFVKSFITFSECDLVFKLNFLTGQKLSFTVVSEDDFNPEESILEVFVSKLSMGYTRLGGLLSSMHLVSDTMKSIKNQAEQQL